MRIIAGEFRGRQLKPPSDRRVRPTADRVREAWFSILGADLHGARVVDLFAGSGALGLEALSRGAEHVTLVELGKPSLAVLRENVSQLDVEDRVTIVRGDASRFAASRAIQAFDIAFADPPYRTGQAERLAQVFRLHPFAAILGIEHDTAVEFPDGETRRYGNVALTFWHAP